MRAPGKWLSALAGLAVFAGAGVAANRSSDQPVPTEIRDWEAFDRIVNNSGMTLQWIDYDDAPRGTVEAIFQNRILMLSGEQRAADGMGYVSFSGTISRVDKAEFLFNGTIIIHGSPDAERRCEKAGEWRFAITENRKYWRLRDFEWCDDLTDYIDIYF
jgi:hypothetical protein